MNLRNYTSSVPVERSVALIEHDLVRAGATNIAKWYDEDSNLDSLMFQITSNGIPMSFRLPARWKKCFDMMMKEVKKPRPGTEQHVREQAQRIAWKVLYDSVSVQISLLMIDQVEVVEVFLPYYYDAAKDQTLFERLKASGFKQLTAGRK